MPRDQVFISYSHKDRKWRDDLDTHLKPCLRDGSIKSWSDKEITPGSKWFNDIKSALQDTKVAVLLVTPNFIASDFIHEHELGPLLKEAKQGGVRILWVPVRASSYIKTALKDYQAVLEPDKPLANMNGPERDQAWVKICEKIEKAVNSPDELREPQHGPEPLKANWSTVLDREAFEGKQDLIVEIVIKTSPITSPWRHSWSHRVIRMPRHYVEAEGFSWNCGISKREPLSATSN